jgi:uncharacterized integral membrane protein (TIGR00698 family)
MRPAALHAAPGVALCLALAAGSIAIEEVTKLPATICALGLGLAIATARMAGLAPGAAFFSTTLLRLAVALLGAKLSIAAFSSLGLVVVAATVLAVGIALAGGYALARAMGLAPKPAIITAGAVAICGVSAALAIHAVVSRRDDPPVMAAHTIAVISLVGTLAMVIYPMAARVAGFGDVTIGILLGGALHEIAHAVGAGFSVSQTAGEAATAIKLIRVACLLPALLVIALAFRNASGPQASKPNLKSFWFLAAFAVLAFLSSGGVLAPRVIEAASMASRLLLVGAMAGIGLNTPIGGLHALGFRPLFAVLLQSGLVLGLFVAACLQLRAQ